MYHYSRKKRNFTNHSRKEATPNFALAKNVWLDYAIQNQYNEFTYKYHELYECETLEDMLQIQAIMRIIYLAAQEFALELTEGYDISKDHRFHQMELIIKLMHIEL
jgi:hypothetical protein